MPGYRSNTATVIGSHNRFPERFPGSCYNRIGKFREAAEINTDNGRMRPCDGFYIRTVLFSGPAMAVFGSMLMTEQNMVFGQLMQIAEQCFCFFCSGSIDQLALCEAAGK